MNTDSKKKAPVEAKRKIKSLQEQEVELNSVQKRLLAFLEKNHVIECAVSKEYDHRGRHAAIRFTNNKSSTKDAFSPSEISQLAKLNSVIRLHIQYKNSVKQVFAHKNNKEVLLFAVNVTPVESEFNMYEKHMMSVIGDQTIKIHEFDENQTSFLRLQHLFKLTNPESKSELYRLDLGHANTNKFLVCSPSDYKLLVVHFDFEDEDDEPEDD